MNRRSFLASVLAAGAGLALDPELALWVPGKKTIFIPSGVSLADEPLSIRFIRNFDISDSRLSRLVNRLDVMFALKDYSDQFSADQFAEVVRGRLGV